MPLPPPFPSDDYPGILDALPAAVYLVDPERRIVLWNDGCERLTGHRREEVIGRCCAGNLLLHCDESGVTKCGPECPLVETMRDGQPRQADLFLRHKAGHRVPVRVRAAPVRNEHGAIVGACECFDERVMSLPEPRRLQLVEPLGPPDRSTQLPSPYAAAKRLEAELRDFEKHRVPFGVLRLAIDNLERLSADDGAIAVDRVLYATAQTLSHIVGPGNFVGRWSEEGFLAILLGCAEEPLLASARTLQHLAGMEAVPWWGDLLTITLSAGGTVVRPGETAEELVERAEAALEDARGLGAGQAVVV